MGVFYMHAIDNVSSGISFLVEHTAFSSRKPKKLYDVYKIYKAEGHGDRKSFCHDVTAVLIASIQEQQLGDIMWCYVTSGKNGHCTDWIAFGDVEYLIPSGHTLEMDKTAFIASFSAFLTLNTHRSYRKWRRDLLHFEKPADE